MRFFPYTLHGRFLVCLALAMILMGMFFMLMLKVHTRFLLTAEAREKANLITAHTEAIQKYVRGTLRPAVSAFIGEDEFIIEAMSTSFVTRHTLSSLNIDKSSFDYRRVAKGARNADCEVTEAEDGLLQRFREQPEMDRIEKTVWDGAAERMLVARPVYFSRDCMRCHGDPGLAPAVLLDMYGRERGFGKTPGELAGLDIISVSMQNTSDAVRTSTTTFGAWFGIGMFGLFCTVQIFFNRLVVHNLKRVSRILQELFFQEEDRTKNPPVRGAGGGPDFVPPLSTRSDIEGMVKSIEAVAVRLAEARRQLSEYACNLEGMVRERTADLAAVASARNADVQLFITLLGSLNKSEEKHALLQASLKLIAGHFGAKLAAYACGTSGLDQFVWPPQSKEELDDLGLSTRLGDPASLLTLEEPELHENYWLLPVQSSGNTRGILGLFWANKADVPSRRPALAFAFSRQLGIALDNLDALNALVGQNAMLDSLVEGVPDPLILVEGENVPLLANSSARILAEELEDEGIRPKAAPGSNLGPVAEDIGTIGLLLRCLGLRDSLLAAQEREEPAHEEVTFANGRSFVAAIYPLAVMGAAPRRSIIHIRETTMEKQMLNRVRRSEKLAAVGQLAAGIAHEINNPLGVIRCYAELLTPTADSGQEAEDIRIILHHVEQAQSVLRDLLDFSRPRAANTGPCDILEFLHSISDLFKARASCSGVSFRLDVPSCLPMVRADRGLLEQVLINLLLNALDAAPAKKGVITLGAKADPGAGSVVVRVADNGPGVEEAALARIFDPFYTTKSSGTGLGLGIAFSMVSEMGGALEARNRYLRGRREGMDFFVTLPLYNAGQASPDSKLKGRNES